MFYFGVSGFNVRRFVRSIRHRSPQKQPGKGSTYGVNWLPAAVKLTAACAIVVVLLVLSVVSSALWQAVAFASSSSASSAYNYSSWKAVSKKISEDLSAADKAYKNADTATAAALANRAYNTGYVATNMIRAVRDHEGQTKSSRQTAVFADISSITYQAATKTREDSLHQKISSLTSDLDLSARKLDASSLGSPRAYGRRLQDQTTKERRKLDAAMVHKNQGKGSRTWTSIAKEMTILLDRAYKAAVSQNNAEKGAALVNEAYYKYYEKLGFEKTVMSAISGSRVSAVEYQFKQARKDMMAGKSQTVINNDINQLKSMLLTDAGILDGTGSEGSSGAAAHINPLTSFFSSAFGQAFIILIREGLEAILVVAAIIAYLVKAGYKNKLAFIYAGVFLGLAASGLMAVILNLFYGASGSNQEMIEGFTALIAMVMLLFTSNWMLNKSSVAGWNSYIKNQTERSISHGSVVSLASLSFLAVFREGAETVLFYQALIGMVSDNDYRALYGGASLAAVILIIVFLLIRFTSVKIPIRPFFAITSGLMSIMVVIFAGSGLHELIEADIIDGSYHNSWMTNDFLGIYPYTETVVFQILIAVVVVFLTVLSVTKQLKQGRENSESQTVQMDSAAFADQGGQAEAQGEGKKL